MERPNPMKWLDEEAPTAAFLGNACDTGSVGGSGGLDLLGLPAGVATRGLAALPEVGEEAAPVQRLLHEVLAVLEGYRAADAPVSFDAGHLDEANRTLLDQTLGQGEVSILVTGAAEYQIQESTLTGVWRIRTSDPLTGKRLGDHVEVGEVPALVRAAATGATTADIPITEPPPGAMNVLPVLAEVRDRAATYVSGTPNHVISFTLLPMNPVDLEVLQATLGTGPVLALSRGYSSCRVVLTARRNVWSVQYMNTQDKVVLDTLEVGDVPLAVRAADEDFADSAARLKEILEAYY
ncbi:MAG TPA: hydrogenase expression/formation protein [Azospirillum sp.]|nr:hydrogenase expression/formation protein [Azospirillum sp.]